MKSFWIWFVPLLFLPTLGFGVPTPFGTLEMIDFLLIPFIPLLMLSPKTAGATLRGEINRLGLLFICWAFATILWIYLKYNYRDPVPVLLFSLLKLAKFFLYSFVGLAISRRLVSDELREKYHFTIVAVGAMTGLSLAIVKKISEMTMGTVFPTAYKVTNMVSVGLSIVFVYVLTLYLSGYGSSRWRKFAFIGLIFMVLGSSFSGGRGGWLAALAGLGYALFYIRLRLRTLAVGISFVIGMFALYQLNADFHRQIDYTLFPDPEYLQTYNAGVGGVDDGARIATWTHELTKLASSPIFGTGFFHRGLESGLWDTGSHNFWLQMFLETGLVGGFFVLYLMFRMWIHAGLYATEDKHVSLALKVALITAFVGGLSGEYFYGSYGLLSLLLVYAPVGSRAAKIFKIS